jgi:hypothetical protein
MASSSQTNKGAGAQAEPEVHNYSKRYVAFVDILGFGSIVNQSQSSPAQTKKLVELLESVTKTIPTAIDTIEDDDYRVQAFSDCIVLSEKATRTGLLHLLATVSAHSVALLGSRILIRGGIAKGLLYHSQNVVFGPAMLEAYRLEQTIARYPRVVVDKSTHLDYKKFNIHKDESPIVRLSQSEDGPIFVDIFALFCSSNVELSPAMIAVGKQCRRHLQTMLNESIYDPRHYEKLRWLADHWNAIVPAEKRLEPVGLADT